MDAQNEPNEWLLISEDTVHEIKELLVTAPQETINKIVYLLNTELHLTDARPADFAEEKE